MNAQKFRQKLAMSVLLGSGSVSITLPAMEHDTTVSEQKKTELGTIIVTGERVERSYMDTSSSVVIFDEQRLSEQTAGADRIEQILDLVPNMQRGAGDVGVTIRGQDTTGALIGAYSFLGGSRSRATLQIDGRPLSYNEFMYGLTSIWDVEQIEVYRGPQTTTQGRNAIAGAVFIDTKDPTFETEAAARAIVGNYGTRQASFLYSGALIENEVAARVAVDTRQHESWMKYTGPDVFVGADREDDNYTTARAKVLYMPEAIPELEFLLTYSHLTSSNPQGETADDPFTDRIQNVQNGGHWDTEVDSLILDANYEINDTWTFNLTSTFAASEVDRFVAPGFGTAHVETDDYSLEGLLRFNPISGHINGIVGVSYFDSDQHEVSDFSAFLGLGNFIDSQQSLGIFGEITLDLTPKTHLTVGGRWQKDSQDRSGILGPAALDYDKSFDSFLPKFEIAYDLNNNTVIGASAKKGYNPGGTTVSFTTGSIDEFDEETLWSYELFTRTSLADGNVLLSGNLFYTDYSNAQRPLFNVITLPNGRTVEDTEFANTPAAESYGFELEGLWKVNPATQVRASVGFLKTEITETLLPNDPLLGNEFQRSPKITAALGINIRPTQPLMLDFSVRHNASYFSDDQNTAAFEIGDITLIDAKATYDLGTFSAFAFVRNATDENYRVWQFRPGNASLGDPREFGIGLEANF